MSTSVSSSAPLLFYSEGSPYARICRMALREGGLLSQVGEQITTLREPAAAVLPYSAVGRVPALVLPGGPTLTETTLVLGWLDRHDSRPTMLPQDDAGLAAYGRALGLIDGIAVWNRELRRPENERSPSVLALEIDRAGRIADQLERDVAAGAYTTVDAGYLALAAALGFGERRHTVWKWRPGHPVLEKWFEQASQRAAFRDTVPPPSGI